MSPTIFRKIPIISSQNSKIIVCGGINVIYVFKFSLVQSFETALEIGDDGQMNAHRRLIEMEPLVLCPIHLHVLHRTEFIVLHTVTP